MVIAVFNNHTCVTAMVDKLTLHWIKLRHKRASERSRERERESWDFLPHKVKADAIFWTLTNCNYGLCTWWSVY